MDTCHLVTHFRNCSVHSSQQIKVHNKTSNMRWHIYLKIEYVVVFSQSSLLLYQACGDVLPYLSCCLWMPMLHVHSMRTVVLAEHRRLVRWCVTPWSLWDMLGTPFWSVCWTAKLLCCSVTSMLDLLEIVCPHQQIRNNTKVISVITVLLTRSNRSEGETEHDTDTFLLCSLCSIYPVLLKKNAK